MEETLDQIKQRISQLERVVLIAEESTGANKSLIPQVENLLRRALFVLSETDDLVHAILVPKRRKPCLDSFETETETN